MDKERFLASGLLEQYVLGLTSPEESEEVERYAAAFPEIKMELESLQTAMQEYAKQRTSGESSTSQPETDSIEINYNKVAGYKNNKTVHWPFLIGLAVLIILAMLSGNLYLQKKELESKVRETSAAFAAFQKQCEEDNAHQAVLEQLYIFLNKPTTQIIRLNGSLHAPDAFAVAYWNESEQSGYINLLSLPSPPAGKQYQIWADIDHKMVNMGLLKAECGIVQPISFKENASSLNITLEVEGGSLKPTVDSLYLNGNVVKADTNQKRLNNIITD